LKEKHGAEKIGFVGVSLGGQLAIILSAFLPLISDSTASLLDGAVAISATHILTQNFIFENPSNSVFHMFNQLPLDVVPKYVDFYSGIMVLPDSSISANSACLETFNQQDEWARSITVPV